MFERFHQPLLSHQAFLLRMLRCVGISFCLLVFTLAIGTAVFHYAEHFSWIDAFLNSVMIMTGLGLVNSVNTSGVKIFIAFYSLCSAFVFFSILAILFTPLLHRLLHHLHLDEEEKDG